MDLDDFPHELEQIRREHYRQHPFHPMQYDLALVERIVAYVLHRRRYDETVVQCSEKLGIAPGKLRKWVYQRRNGAVITDQVALRSLPPLSMLLPVQVRAEQVFVQDGVPERRYSVRSPAGFEVRDLRMDELVVLLRSLS
jgi:hypothetical protein